MESLKKDLSKTEAKRVFPYRKLAILVGVSDYSCLKYREDIKEETQGNMIYTLNDVRGLKRLC